MKLLVHYSITTKSGLGQGQDSILYDHYDDEFDEKDLYNLMDFIDRQLDQGMRCKVLNLTKLPIV